MLSHHQFSYPAPFLLSTLFFLLLHFGITTSQLLCANDISALRIIKDSLTDMPDSAGKRFFSSWDFLANDPCSSFLGITCLNTDPSSPSILRVTSLTLGTGFSNSPGLAGSLPPAIANLTELTQLVLFAGIVAGSIPSQLGNLKNLRIISLTNNRLTGPIPPSLFALRNLHTLDLSYNKLTGKMPERLLASPALKVLVLASNELSGGVPQQLPPQLLHLDLKNNALSGTLPRRMPSALRYLSVSRNNMWGPLDGLQSLSELVYLDLSMNHFSGSLPPSLFRPSLSSMFLQRNNLSGTLPSSLSLSLSSSSLSMSYDLGSTVDLSHNFLGGQLTTILVGVENVFLNNNRFVGAVPTDYIRSLYDGTTKTLYLQHNYISEFPMGNPGPALPDSVSLCLTYNCMVPPQVGVATCPASAGSQISRPLHQCSLYKNGSSMG